MKKLFFISFCILFVTVTSGQIRSGEVIYKVHPPKNVNEFIDTTGKDPQFKQWIIHKYEAIRKATPRLKYTLKFNKKAAIFTHPQTMTNDNGMDLEETARATGATGLFYSNTEKNITLHQRKNYGKTWLVKTSMDQLSWHIEADTKTIDGYTCQKAIAKSDYLNAIKKSTPITAWFCRDLPFQFGPKGITGLPGMILKLTYNHYTFYADKINLKQSPESIKKPTKGKVVSPAEFDKIVRKHAPARPEAD